MREGIAVKQQKKRTSRRACQHRWIIESPHGATSRGHCKLCGTTRRFPNAAEDAMWEGGSSALGRFANRRSAARPSQVRFGKDRS